MKRQESAPDNHEQLPARFESDTERIIHRHLANEDDVITDDDIRSVRIGLTPPETDTENTGTGADTD